MKNSYSLRINHLVREVEVNNPLVGHNKIFKTNLILNKKLNEICDEEFFSAIEVLGLERFRKKQEIINQDRSRTFEYGFLDKYFRNKKSPETTSHTWIRINNGGFIEVEPEMSSIDHHSDEEKLAYANLLLHLTANYIEKY